MASSHNYLIEGSGLLVRKAVPSDNSCLFTSLYYLLKDKKTDFASAQVFRSIVAKEVIDNPSRYTEAALGMSHIDYATWIKSTTNWGGALDTFILCKHFSTEIVVVDTISGTIIRFGEAQNFGQRVFLYYDGIHYDPLEVESDYVDTTVIFPTSAKWVLDMALQLAIDGHQSGDFVNLNTFTLKCSQCCVLLIGEKEAGRHAIVTSHNKFEEYKPL